MVIAPWNDAPPRRISPHQAAPADLSPPLTR